MRNKKTKKIIIIGAGQLGILVSNIIKRQKLFDITGFIDNDKRKKNKIVNSFKVLRSEDYLLNSIKKNVNLVIAFGNIKRRELTIKKLINNNFKFPPIIDPSCNIDKGVKIGRGTIVCNSSTILNNTELGEFSVIGTAVNILHHVKISNNCIIGGGSTVGSNVNIHKNVFVGVGATFASKNITIKRNSFICSGSAVFNNVPEQSKVIGNPAKLIPSKL
jgi:sugar O-acyltransferase (sialic acid O-acetyltransferase NeuD family)|tara:strand:+ start:54 stop:707 length:654 start_codon:yes stop_codon:yes gene_type:complete